VAVTALFAKGEALEESDTAKLLDLLQEVAGGHSQTPQADEGQDKPAATQGRRRRHENKLGNPEGEQESPTETPAPSASAGSRRRRERAAPSADADQTESERQPEAETGSSQGNGRRRRECAANPTTQEQSSASTAGPGSGRRTRGAATPAGSAPSAKDDEISDMDLAKAASQAVTVILPSAVTELLEEFDCTKVNQLYKDQRRPFLDKLAKLVSAAGKGEK